MHIAKLTGEKTSLSNVFRRMIWARKFPSGIMIIAIGGLPTGVLGSKFFEGMNILDKECRVKFVRLTCRQSLQ